MKDPLEEDNFEEGEKDPLENFEEDFDDTEEIEEDLEDSDELDLEDIELEPIDNKVLGIALMCVGGFIVGIGAMLRFLG